MGLVVESADSEWNASGVACRKGRVVEECTRTWVQGYVNGMNGSLTGTVDVALAVWIPSHTDYPHTGYLIRPPWNLCPTMK